MMKESGTFIKSKNCYVIAEIGTGHEGKKGRVKELIQACAESGADCAKFQIVIAEEILHPLTGEIKLPGGQIRIYDRFKSLEQNSQFYLFCREETEKAGLDFLCSPFGIKSARILKEIGSKQYKIASPELNHFPLIRELNSYGEPLIFSSGVSLLKDIEKALNLALQVPVALLHCITAYPAPPEEYNLRILQPLAKLFGVRVGISDHSMDPSLVPLVGIAAGASLIEKHICLSRQDNGLDDPIALDPELFAKMVRDVRNLERSPAELRLKVVKELFSSNTVEAVLGSGRKTLAPSELANYTRTNRSIHALHAMKAGDILKVEDLAILRTEKILRPGLDPDLLNTIVGKHLTRDVKSGDGIVWDDLLL